MKGSLFSCLAASLIIATSARATTNSCPPIKIDSNGTVFWAGHASPETSATRTAGSSVGKQPQPVQRSCTFGMAGKTLRGQWLDNERLPICHISWEDQNIQYSQTVFIAQLDEGVPTATNLFPSNAVLLVQLGGKSLANDYSEGTAALQMMINGQRISLDLKESDVMARDRTIQGCLGVIDMPSGGNATTNDLGLRFSASLPPAQSGTMSLKIPLTPITDPKILARLQNMNVDDEYRRVKNHWSSVMPKDTAHLFPLELLPKTAAK